MEMEKSYTGKSGKKRVRDESVPSLEQTESKRVHSDLSLQMDSSELKRVASELDGDSPEPGRNQDFVDLDSPQARLTREDIFDFLDEPDNVTDRDPAIEDLVSVMRSLEEEILHPSPQPPTMVIHNPTPKCGDCRPDLGFLLDASDDELGLPPTVSPSEEEAGNKTEETPKEATKADELRNMLGFEDELPGYDSFGFGTDGGALAGDDLPGNINDEYVAVGGLFDFSEQSEFSDLSWRPESLPAL